MISNESLESVRKMRNEMRYKFTVASYFKDYHFILNRATETALHITIYPMRVQSLNELLQH